MNIKWLFVIILTIVLFSMTSSAMLFHGYTINDGKLPGSGHSWAGYGKDKACGDGPLDIRFKIDRIQGGFQVNINMIQNIRGARYAIGFIDFQNGSLSVYLNKEKEDQTFDLLSERTIQYYRSNVQSAAVPSATPTEIFIREEIENEKGHISVFLNSADQEFSRPIRPIIEYFDEESLPPGNIDFETLEGSSVLLSEVMISCSSSNYMGAASFKEPDLSYLIDATSAPDSSLPFSVRWGEVPANQILVMIDPTIGFIEARGIAEQLASRLEVATDQDVQVVGELEYINLFQIETKSRSLQELIRDVAFARSFPSIVAAFPNQQISSENSHTLNPIYSKEYGKGYRMIGVQEAWNAMDNLNTFSKVIVGVVDDGIYLGDQQFDNVDINTSINIYPRPPPCILTSRKEWPLNIAGSHGTGVANILAANSKELQGIASYLPKEKLKIFMINISGKGKSFITSSMLAFQFEIQNGSSIISCSMGKTDEVEPEAAIMYDKFFTKLSKDPKLEKVLFIFSAGNEGDRIDGKDRIPNGLPINKSLPNVITVGNILNDRKAAPESNKNSQNYPKYITLAAPGEEALWGCSDNNKMDFGGGTSMATPQVTAAAILIRSIDPCLTAGQIKARLIETANDNGPLELGNRILAIDKAVKMTISQRTKGFCSSFGPGVSIDLPEGLNNFKDVWGVADIGSKIEILNAVYTDSNRRILYCQEGNILLVYNRIYLSGSGLGDIKKVTYYLHESFPNPVQVSNDSSNGFEIWIMTWGSFLLRAEIETKSGKIIEKDYNFSFRSKVEEAKGIGIPMVLVPCDADLSQWSGQTSNGAPPAPGTQAPSGFDTTITIISGQYKGYTVSVDGQQIGVEGQGQDVLDGKYTFTVAGNQQHLIRIDHPMNWKWWRYFYNAGDSITYDF